MRLKGPKPLHWTKHARWKMRLSGLSEQRVKRVLNAPKRVEEGIAPKTVAYMQPATGAKRPSEIWAMVADTPQRRTIVTAWRYPGKSPVRNPIPQEVLEEIKSMKLEA